jgi:mevalonate kinase
MATYEEYLEHAKSKNFQPVKEGTFNSLSKAGFDPIKNTFEKANKLNLAPLPEGMPKLTEAIAKADAERAERKAAKASGGGGGGGIPKLNRDLTKNMKAGGKVSSASKRADGCAIRGKTRA